MPPKKEANPKATAKSKAKVVNRNQAAIAQLLKLQEARKKQMNYERNVKQKEKEKNKKEQEILKQRREEEKKIQQKKEEEKKRKQELRKTKSERDEQRKMKSIQRKLLASGVEISGLQKDVEEKPVISLAEKRRMKKRQRELAEKKKEEEAARKAQLKAEKEAAAKQEAEEAEEDDDDWEKLVDAQENQDEEEEESEESGDSEDSDIPMDPESIMARHNVRMERVIQETISVIRKAQEESESAIASVSIASTTSVVSKDDIDFANNQYAEQDLPLRSPVICILGHVDVGKTKILDKLRQTNVQTAEAGGITQQIGATFFPIKNITPTLRQVESTIPQSTYNKVPGLLVIDTPGHESFTNLRSRGSSMCNLAILVVDIMHSLEQQTLESLNMILSRNTPFVIALNKIDMLSGWKPCTVKTPSGEIDRSFQTVLNSQSDMVKDFFERRLTTVITDLAHQGVNAALYTDTTKDFSDYVRIIPTSAKTGEGLPDLLANLLQIGQQELEEEIRIRPELSATVMEIKTIVGLGTTADVILANGTLSEGDTIVVCGSEGAIVSQVRSLLTPHPMKEIRVKTEYLSHKSIMASIGVKVCAPGLENALAGSQLHVAYDPEEVEVLKDKVEEDFESVMASFERQDTGAYVVASTVGSLEALVTYLQSIKPPIPIGNVSVGPVHKKDVIKASVMVEKDPKYAVILAFDVPIDPDAHEEAEKQKVQIFSADIIYHLTTQFERYLEDLKMQEAEQRKKSCIYPARLSILQCFHESDPLILGVHLDLGRLRPGVSLLGINVSKTVYEQALQKALSEGKSGAQAKAAATAAAERERKVFEIGYVESIEKDKTPLKVAEQGAEVAIKIGRGKNAVPVFGKMLDETTQIITKFDRASLDYIKEFEKSILEENGDYRKFIFETRSILGISAPSQK